MAQSTTNVIVGAANLAIGTFSDDYSATGDTLWNQLKQAVGAGKDYRAWITALTGSTGAGTAVSVVGALQTPLAAGVGTATFRDAGLTQEGVEIQYSPDYGEVEVDQLLDAARLFKQAMTISVATTFAEATLEHLMVTWAQGGGTRYTDSHSGVNGAVRLSGGNLGEAPVEKALLFVGNAPGTQTTYKQRVYLTTRALSVEASTHGLKRNEPTVIPVTFRLLPDTSASYSSYGRVVDIS